MSTDSLGLAEPFTQVSPARPRRVMLVEDHPNNRRVLQLMLQHLGVRPSVVVDSAAAADAFADHSFDLILMDLHMPQAHALEASRKIREIELRQGRSATPIMTFTANTLVEDPGAGRNEAIDDFIPKPVKGDSVADRVDHDLDVDKPVAADGRPIPAGAQVYDLAVLERLGSDVGEELIPELLAGFEEDLQQHLEAIPRLREAGDTVTLTRTAHSLKSSSATFGACRLSAIALVVEMHGRQEAFDALYAALPELLSEMHLALQHSPRAG